MPRLLKGYVTRTFQHDVPGFGMTRAAELDMPAPAGLSGGPLFRGKTANVMGVIYGDTESYSITDCEQVDSKTGERTPESRKIVTFGVAHRVETVINARGPAARGTRGLTVGEYLKWAR